MSFPRSSSPGRGYVLVVDLDNLESLQDRWAKQTIGMKAPPPPPQLNSPRSLEACRLCGFPGGNGLEKRSLRQHLTDVLGDPEVDTVVRSLSEEVETRAAMQIAVLAFQREAIGLGTAKEKLVAHRTFQAQEHERVPRLASAREVRRQLMAEEAYDRRRKTHVESSSERSNLSASRRRAGSSTRRRRVSSWSDTVGATLIPPLPKKKPSRPSSRQSSREAVPPSPMARPAPSSKTTTTNSTTTTTATDLEQARGTGGNRSATPTQTGRQLLDFTPSPTRDGYMPYVPRNAASLNTNVFGNRTFSSPVSNPSRTPLGARSTTLDDSATGAGRVDAHKPVTGRTLAGSDSLDASRRRRPDGGGVAAVAGEVPADSHGESFSVGKITPGGRNDLSMVSIGSSQLGWVLNSSAEGQQNSATGSRQRPPPSPAQADGATVAPVSLFHQQNAAVKHSTPPQSKKPAAAPTTDPAPNGAKPPVPRTSVAAAPNFLRKSTSTSTTARVAAADGVVTDAPVTTAAPQPAPLPAAPSAQSQPVPRPRAREPSSPSVRIEAPICSPPNTLQDGQFFFFCANPKPLCSA